MTHEFMAYDTIEQTGRHHDGRDAAVSREGGRTSQRTWLDRLGRAVGNHPKTAVAAAIGVGATVGWLIKRK